MNKNKVNHNINIEKVKDYKYIIVNKKNELNLHRMKDFSFSKQKRKSKTKLWI